MKKMSVICAAVIALSVPVSLFAMNHDHGSMKMEHGMDHGKEQGGMMAMGKLAHEEVVDGVKASFRVMDVRAAMEKAGRKETSHIMVVFSDASSGKKLSEGEVKVKVLGPDKAEQVKDLMGMEGGFGADFTMSNKGRYGVMAKFKLKNGKVRSTKFWYEVK